MSAGDEPVCFRSLVVPSASPTGPATRALLDKKQRILIAGALAAYEKTPNAKCPCCGYFGRFLPFGLTNRPGAYCPECGARERHRQIQLAFDAKFFEVNAKRVLHFAPEMPVRRMILRGSPAEYKTADIVPGLGDLTLNIEHLELAPDSFDLILCSHVLEHVDDRAALSEMFRVLSRGGLLIAMVPLIEGWDHTYENRTITAPADRECISGKRITSGIMGVISVNVSDLPDSN